MKFTNLNAFKIKHGLLSEKNVMHLQDNFNLLSEKDKDTIYKVTTKSHDKFVKKYESFLTRGKVLSQKKDGDAIAEVKIPKRFINALCGVGTGALCVATIEVAPVAVPISLAAITLLLTARTILWNQLHANKFKPDYTIKRYQFPLEHHKKVKFEYKIDKLEEILKIIEDKKIEQIMNSSKAQTSEQQDKLKELDEKLQELATKSEEILAALSLLNKTKEEIAISKEPMEDETSIAYWEAMDEDAFPTQENATEEIKVEDLKTNDETTKTVLRPKDQQEDDLQM